MKIILKLESNNVYMPIILGKNSSYRDHYLKLIFFMVKLKTKITQNSLACRNYRKEEHIYISWVNCPRIIIKSALLYSQKAPV